MLSFGKLVRSLNTKLKKHGLSSHIISHHRKRYIRKSSSRKRSYKKKRSFGSTHYQQQLNNLTGNLGPTSSAFWKPMMKTTGPAYSLGAQPLYYAPAQGVYVTSADVPASQGSVNFSNFGFGGRRKSKCRHKSRCPCFKRKRSFGRHIKKRSGKKRSGRKRSGRKFPSGKTPKPLG